jgi:hypothetical protein
MVISIIQIVDTTIYTLRHVMEMPIPIHVVWFLIKNIIECILRIDKTNVIFLYHLNLMKKTLFIIKIHDVNIEKP